MFLCLLMNMRIDRSVYLLICQASCSIIQKEGYFLLNESTLSVRKKQELG
jgi:hypothetical protein